MPVLTDTTVSHWDHPAKAVRLVINTTDHSAPYPFMTVSMDLWNEFFDRRRQVGGEEMQLEQVYQGVLVALVLLGDITHNVRHMQPACVLGLVQGEQLLLPPLPRLTPPPLHTPPTHISDNPTAYPLTRTPHVAIDHVH